MKMARLGVLLFGAPDTDAFPTIREALHALGYVEGRNIAFEHRYSTESRFRSGCGYGGCCRRVRPTEITSMERPQP
jgi:hypothetical protein